MKTQIQINCPDCHSPSLKKNGKKSYGKQNYQYKDCKRQFIGDHALTYNGCHSRIEDKEITLSPGVHSELIRDIIEDFAERFAPNSILIYAGDTEKKWGYFDEERLKKLGRVEHWRQIDGKKNSERLIFKFSHKKDIVRYASHNAQR